MKFQVNVSEVHTASYAVEANSESEAIQLVAQGKGEFIDDSGEFDRLIDQGSWTAAKIETPAVDTPDSDILENLTDEDANRINKLGRQQIVEILEGAGIQCYDTEHVDELRQALRVNVADGTVTLPEEE